MAADTSRKTRQMPALRPRIKISDDRRTHHMVLRSLSEENMWRLGCQPDRPTMTDPNFLYDKKTFAYRPAGMREDDADEAYREPAGAAGRRFLYRRNSRRQAACRIQDRHARWSRSSTCACGLQDETACGKIRARSVWAGGHRRCSTPQRDTCPAIARI